VIDCLGAIFEPYHSFQRRSIEFDEIIVDLQDLPVKAILAPPPKEADENERGASIKQDYDEQEADHPIQIHLVSPLLFLSYAYVISLLSFSVRNVSVRWTWTKCFIYFWTISTSIIPPTALHLT
jgi:hypothetical protein